MPGEMNATLSLNLVTDPDQTLKEGWVARIPKDPKAWATALEDSLEQYEQIVLEFNTAHDDVTTLTITPVEDASEDNLVLRLDQNSLRQLKNIIGFLLTSEEET